tara:strand:- start:202 stop:522 length:321 start_codon:yes stop_codon:yes gene_type:complete
MKFNPVLRTHNSGVVGTPNEQTWRVTAGRGKLFVATFETEAEATQFAIQQTAVFHIIEAQRLVEKITDWHKAAPVGVAASDIVDHVTDAGIEAGLVDIDDARGWLA